MNIYLAHNFAARLELRPLCAVLERQGHHVTSRWITDDAHVTREPVFSAEEDLEDIDRADALIFFTDEYGGKPGTGKFIELGYAIGKWRLVYLCGEVESKNKSVFFHLPFINHITREQLEAGDWE